MKCRLAPMAVISLLVIVSGCSDNRLSSDSSSAFSQPSPADGADNVSCLAELTWRSDIDPGLEPDYKVFVSTIPDPGGQDQEEHNQSPNGFLPGRNYMWHVEAHLPGGKLLRSPLWHFRTADQFEYPLELGLAWDYTVSTYLTDIVYYDSLVEPITDLEFGALVTADSFAVLPENGKPAYRLTESRYGDIYYPSASYGWFNNESGGFYNYAYEGAGTITIPRKPSNRVLHPIDPRLEHLMNLPIFSNPASASINGYTFEPVLSLAYPLVRGREWVFSSDSPLGVIRKRAADFRTFNIGGRLQRCWMIKWVYDPVTFDFADDIDFVDYISKDGLVKRTLTVRNMVFGSHENPYAARATWHQDVILDSTYLVTLR